jgi:hypothetical protein
VRAIDPSGNVGQPTEASWTVDTTPPAVSITEGPEASTTSPSAGFAFTASEPPEAFECSLDGGAFAACGSPVAYDGLRTGQHTFAVRARDSAGNWTEPPANRGWTVVDQGEQPPPDDPPPDPGETPPLTPPDPGDPDPEAWALPELAVKVPASQTIVPTLRRGLKTMATSVGACPCRLTYTLRLNTRLARSVGLIGKRAADAGRTPTIGRAYRALPTAGRTTARVRLSRRARARLANVTRLRATLSTKLADRYNRRATSSVRVRLGR